MLLRQKQSSRLTLSVSVDNAYNMRTRHEAIQAIDNTSGEKEFEEKKIFWHNVPSCRNGEPV